MSTYITLGADENGEVYGLEIGEDGKWEHNSLGLSTSCAVIRPVSKETYEYVTEDPKSAKDLWQACVAAGKTELGLEEWFKEYTAYDEPFDVSFVSDLLDDENNPTVRRHDLSIKERIDEDGQPLSFREHVKKVLLESPDVNVSGEDDVYEWESSGWFSPSKPFVVEFAPHDLIEEYYLHLESCKYVRFKRNRED
jgi:hypothetical protein